MSTNRKILVRNIPEMIYVQFEQMAAENHRSVEGQARYVLTQAAEDYFKPKDIENARKKRCRVIGQRLQCMQKNVEKAYTPSKLAYLIGDESAHFIESCFAGEEDPSFSQLEGIARIYGIRFDWLAHGTGDMFYNDYKRLPEDPKSAATWLTSNGEDVPWPKEDMVSEVFFVRNNSQAGELAIVKKSHENRWAIFRTPTHVSSEIGNGGEAMLVALFRTLRLMWSIHLRGNKEFKQTDVYSHILKEEDFDALIDGNTSPGLIFQKYSHRPWWEDIWDRKMVQDTEYWKGYHELKQRILASEKLQRQEEQDIKAACEELESATHIE